MKPSRPTGIAIIAILTLLVGVLLLLGAAAAAAISGTGILMTMGYGSLLSAFAGLFAAFLAIVGILAIVVGWGLWTGKGWAWLLAIVLYALGALSSLISLLTGSLGSIIGLLIDVLLLWYMFRPHVKAFFGRGMASASMTQPPPSATT